MESTSYWSDCSTEKEDDTTPTTIQHQHINTSNNNNNNPIIIEDSTEEEDNITLELESSIKKRKFAQPPPITEEVSIRQDEEQDHPPFINHPLVGSSIKVYHAADPSNQQFRDNLINGQKRFINYSNQDSLMPDVLNVDSLISDIIYRFNQRFNLSSSTIILTNPTIELIQGVDSGIQIPKSKLEETVHDFINLLRKDISKIENESALEEIFYSAYGIEDANKILNIHDECVVSFSMADMTK